MSPPPKFENYRDLLNRLDDAELENLTEAEFDAVNSQLMRAAGITTPQEQAEIAAHLISGSALSAGFAS